MVLPELMEAGYYSNRALGYSGGKDPFDYVFYALMAGGTLASLLLAKEPIKDMLSRVKSRVFRSGTRVEDIE